MTRDKEFREPFLSRWSRLKQESAAAPPAPPAPKSPTGAVPELPPVEQLTLESDFRAFLHPKVEERLKREALKKLFGDPHFNRMDGLDVYIDDYNIPDPLPEGMLQNLTQYRTLQDQRKATEEERAAREKGEALPVADQGDAAPPQAPPAKAAELPSPSAEAAVSQDMAGAAPAKES
ncbi:MAG TPA: DUF3306 domain-containing protein [Burkholderiales bacterium]|nr:DUF3306 domain-containing protein [Burkholderiales bacterium]